MKTANDIKIGVLKATVIVLEQRYAVHPSGANRTRLRAAEAEIFALRDTEAREHPRA